MINTYYFYYIYILTVYRFFFLKQHDPIDYTFFGSKTVMKFYIKCEGIGRAADIDDRCLYIYFGSNLKSIFIARVHPKAFLFLPPPPQGPVIDFQDIYVYLYIRSAGTLFPVIFYAIYERVLCMSVSMPPCR